jgi:hypothetical protein
MLDERALIIARSRPNSREGKELRAAHREERDMTMFGAHVLMRSDYIATEAGRQAFQKLANEVRSLVRGSIEIPDVNELHAYRRLYELYERVLADSQRGPARESKEYQDACEWQERSKIHNRIVELVPQLRHLGLDNTSAEALELQLSDFDAPTAVLTGPLEELQAREARMAAAIADWPTMSPARKLALCLNVHLGRFEGRIEKLEKSNATLLDIVGKLLKGNLGMLNNRLKVIDKDIEDAQAKIEAIRSRSTDDVESETEPKETLQ